MHLWYIVSDITIMHEPESGCVGCPLFDGDCGKPWCSCGGKESDFYDLNPRCPLLKGDVIIKRKEGES